MGEDGNKPLIGGRVPEDTAERFEAYREDRGINKTDALRRLLEKGLDEIEAEEQEHREDARTSTGMEEWLQERARSWLGFGVLSAAGFATMFGLFAVNMYTVTLVPDWPISLAMFVMLFGFLMFTGASALATVALRTGLARQLAQMTAGESEVEA